MREHLNASYLDLLIFWIRSTLLGQIRLELFTLSWCSTNYPAGNVQHCAEVLLICNRLNSIQYAFDGPCCICLKPIWLIVKTASTKGELNERVQRGREWWFQSLPFVAFVCSVFSFNSFPFEFIFWLLPNEAGEPRWPTWLQQLRSFLWSSCASAGCICHPPPCQLTFQLPGPWLLRLHIAARHHRENSHDAQLFPPSCHFPPLLLPDSWSTTTVRRGPTKASTLL